MGNAAPRAQPLTQDTASQYRTYLTDFAPRSSANALLFKELINDGRFFKTIRCTCNDGKVIVKIYRKYDNGDHENQALQQAEVALRRLSLAFAVEEKTPNLIPYASYRLSAKYNVAFIARQYFMSNLYDRICSRPFWTVVEKKWVAYQLLRALEQAHACGIKHGDIKQENVMVTSWNWVFLTDFAPFKPTCIPEDDPANFNYYFCAIDATRRACCVAPERFSAKISAGKNDSSGPSAQKILSRMSESGFSADDIDQQVLDVPTDRSSVSNPVGMTPSQPQERQQELQESMDVFSVGCVIAELFLGGNPLFDLPSLLRYRTGDASQLKAKLRKIGDPALEDMLLHMLQLDPNARLSARQYLARYKEGSTHSLFPAYFENYLFRFLVLILSRGGKVPDARIRHVCKHYGRIVKEVAGVDDPEGEQFFKMRLKEGYGSDRQMHADVLNQEHGSHVAQRVLREFGEELPRDPENNSDRANSPTNLNESDTEMFLSATAQRQKIETLHDQYFALTEKKKRTLRADSPMLEHKPQELLRNEAENDTSSAEDHQDASPPRPSIIKQKTACDQANNGIVIILSLVCSSLRHVQIPESKLTAIYLIRYLGQVTTDEVRLQRLIPFLLEIVTDSSASVRALTARTITYLVSLVTSFPLSDANIFPQYILPLMTKLPVDDDELVRIAFAECLPLLASTSRRFLETAHAMKQKNLAGGIPPTPLSTMSTASIASTFSSGTSGSRNGSADVTAGSLALASSNFDKELHRLHKMISRFVVQLAQTSSSLVKRALLCDITRLCIFFGRERTLDVVLPQLTTFLNDGDWELRGAFFDHITGVCAFVGRVTVECNILPLIEAQLADVEEIVIAKAIECLGTLCQLGLFQKSTGMLTDKAKITCLLLLHPSWWVRDAVIKLMSILAVQMGNVNANVFLSPMLRPYLKKPIMFMPEEREADILLRLRNCCRPFISRKTYEAALYALAAGNDIEDTDSSSSSKPSERDASEVSSHFRDPRADALGLTLPGLDEFEQKKGELQGLELMKPYVAIAAIHMQSKLNLVNQEQSARMQNQLKLPKNSENGGPRKLSRSSLHVLSVPDMRFALTVANPLKSSQPLLPQLPASKTTPMSSALSLRQQPSASLPPQALSLDVLSTQSIIRMYGLVSPNLPQPSENWKLQPSISAFDDGSLSATTSITDTSRFAANGAMVTKLNHNVREVHGINSSAGSTIDPFIPSPIRPRVKNVGMYAHSLISESSTDPAMMNPRKLLARLTAMNVPPMPPDLGPLRATATGDTYSIYAHALSPQKLSQYSSMGISGNSTSGDSTPTSASQGHGSFRSAPFALPPPTTTSTNASSNGGSNGSYARGFLYRNWRPRRNLMVAELGEHCGAVNRLGASQDSSFLASASSDGTVKIWSIRSMQHSINQGSRGTYEALGGVVTDMIVLDNSHSIAAASTNGTVHVFRVDSVGVNTNNPNFQLAGVRELSAGNTAVMVLDHLNNVTESLLLYATRTGLICAWDLRTREQVWALEVSPELGFVTCMTHALDGTWLTAGTSRGYICVWDLRFLVLIRIWRHSSQRRIHRLTPCLGLPNSAHTEDEPLVFVAAGDNEVAVFNIGVGACRAVYRTLEGQVSKSEACACPTLLHVAIPHRNRSVLGSVIGIYGISTTFWNYGIVPYSEEASVRAILCPSLHFRGVPDAVITAGGDKQIRYWDIRNGKTSFTVSGDDNAKEVYNNYAAPSNWWRLSPSATQPSTTETSSELDSAAAMLAMPSLPAVSENDLSTAIVASSASFASASASSLTRTNGNGSPTLSKPEIAWSKMSPPMVTLCQDTSLAASQAGLGPIAAASSGGDSAVRMERRGLVAPSPAHTDCVLDLALIDLNGPVLVSSGRDGLIKVWK